MRLRRLLVPAALLAAACIVTPGASVAAGTSLATSTVTIDLLPTTGVLNHPEELAGMLSFSDSASPDGLSVDVTQTSPDGGTTDLGEQSLSFSGDYSLYSPNLTEYGTYTFTATYPGDATHSAAVATETVTVPRITTEATLSASVAKLVYGNTVTLSAWLGGVPVGTSVSIERKVNGVTSVAATGAIDSSDRFTFTAHPSENTVYWASYAGDSSHAPTTSTTKTVLVQPVITGAFTGSYGKDGNYHLFHYHASCGASGTACPIFTEHFIPANPGHVVYAVLQLQEKKGWTNLLSWKGTLGAKSLATFKLRYKNQAVGGANYRLVAEWPKGVRWAAVSWGYWYFRITK